jgi:hypothetical protein
MPRKHPRGAVKLRKNAWRWTIGSVRRNNGQSGGLAPPDLTAGLPDARVGDLAKRIQTVDAHRISCPKPIHMPGKWPVFRVSLPLVSICACLVELRIPG